MSTIKKYTESLNILKTYSGNNPYLLMLKRDVYINKKTDAIGDFQVEYILKNEKFVPKQINKVVKITQWYGENRKEAWNLDFIPQKLKICTLLGETETTYNCYVQYRQSIPPVMCFIPKRGLLNNFLVDDFTLLDVDFNRYDRLSMEKDNNRRLREHQKDGIKFLLSRKKCILADDMGLGKLEPNSSLIPTPNGFVQMGDLKIGEYVFGQDGKKHVVSNIFPHKNKEIYNVKFSDGTSCDCGLDHLWVVRDSRFIKGNNGWKTMSLKDIINNGLKYGEKNLNKWEIPICDAVDYDERNFYIHPYLLGLYICKGDLCNGIMHFDIKDSEKETNKILTKLLNENFILLKDKSGYNIINKNKQYNDENLYCDEIKRLKLNVSGSEMFIPEEYKLGSIEQRLELLRGLMDYDGRITKEKNNITFSTKSEILANDIKELVYSLGGIAVIDFNDIIYNISIQIKYNPFNLEQKKKCYKPICKKNCKKYIVSADYVRNEDARCIMVDYDKHTYLTGKNYIVTHNTTQLSVAAIEGNFDSVLIICPASLKTNWKKELLWYVDEKDITIIESFDKKTKPELERFLGYSEGRSNKTREELLEEANNVGKWQNNRFVIVNYDILDNFYSFSRATSEEGKLKALDNSPLLKYIHNRKSCIIIDESHKLSNNTSTRYKVIKDLIKKGKPDSIYLSTGTPITNNPQNLYYLLKLIENEVTSDYEYYMNTYCDAKKFPAKGEKEKWTNYFLKSHHKNSWYELTFQEKDELKSYIKKHARMITVANGASNLNELKEKISHIYLRRTKDDLKLPKKTIHEIFYDLSTEQKEEYDKLWNEYEKQQLELDPNKEINKNLLEGAIYRKYISNQMVPNTIKLCDSIIKNGDKCVIACCYDDELYTLQEYFGDKCVIYNGKMNSKQKDEAIKKFMNEKDCLVFIGNIIAAGVGITLTKAHNLIFNNISYVPADNLQMQDRIHRLGQTKNCDIYYQIFKETQYENMWKIVLKKSIIIDTVIIDEKNKNN